MKKKHADLFSNPFLVISQKDIQKWNKNVDKDIHDYCFVGKHAFFVISKTKNGPKKVVWFPIAVSPFEELRQKLDWKEICLWDAGEMELISGSSIDLQWTIYLKVDMGQEGYPPNLAISGRFIAEILRKIESIKFHKETSIMLNFTNLNSSSFRSQLEPRESFPNK